jgi:hypothetical protein
VDTSGRVMLVNHGGLNLSMPRIQRFAEEFDHQGKIDRQVSYLALQGVLWKDLR